MSNQLILELQNTLPSGMTIPHELILLYEWIESNDLFEDSKIIGRRIGTLYPEEELRNSIKDDRRDGGTSIEFYSHNSDLGVFWFGAESIEIKNRLCVFAQSGGDGSVCALWLDDNQVTRIVHIGSGSGSTLLCELGIKPVDFIRLIAIGYDEICWNEEFDNPPSSSIDIKVAPNVKFQNWVKNTFKVDIPETASEIVKHPASMDDEQSEDRFFNWCQKYNE